MVVTESGDVVVFDADTDTLIETIPLPGIGVQNHADCEVTSDLTQGFVVNFTSQLYFIDLTASPPAIVNTIGIPNPGEDVVLSLDEKYLIVCDGSALAPLAVVDVATQTVVSTSNEFSDCNSVEVCADGSVLGTSINQDRLGLYTLDAAGTLTLVDDFELDADPQNLACAGSSAGVVMYRNGSFRSYTLPGGAFVDLVDLPAGSGRGASAAFDADGNRLFVRTEDRGVEIYGFDPLTADVLPSLLNIPTGDVTNSLCYGIEQLALHPDETRLYVPERGQVAIHDPDTGALLGSIPFASPSIEPLGICIARAAECFLVLGAGPGSEAFAGATHSWDTYLSSVTNSFAVTLDDIPSFPLPHTTHDRIALQQPVPVGTFSAQVLMWNPDEFPDNPEQFTAGLRVIMWSNGRVTGRRYGSSDGMELTLETYRETASGQRFLRFPFSIDGF